VRCDEVWLGVVRVIACFSAPPCTLLLVKLVGNEGETSP